jgi:hypothetical protein
MNFFHAIGKQLAAYLSSPIETDTQVATSKPSELARYLISSPPVPSHLKRRLLAFGSGDPTKAICSSMIAQAFQSIGYPILPERKLEVASSRACRKCYREIHHIKHHSLFVPRDFDASPYFAIIKPTLSQGFSHYQSQWVRPPEPKKNDPGNPKRGKTV